MDVIDGQSWQVWMIRYDGVMHSSLALFPAHSIVMCLAQSLFAIMSKMILVFDKATALAHIALAHIVLNVPPRAAPRHLWPRRRRCQGIGRPTTDLDKRVHATCIATIRE